MTMPDKIYVTRSVKTDNKTIKGYWSNLFSVNKVPYIRADKVQKLVGALETPMRMVDADMMFGLSEFDYLPYETVQSIARAAVKIVGQRNQEALKEFEGSE